MSVTAEAAIAHINLEDFQSHVIESSFDQPVLLDLWADWCPSCSSLSPIFDRVAAELSHSVSFVKMDVDEGDNMKIAGQYEIRGFPAVLLIKDGEEKERFYSTKPKSFIVELINRWL